MMDNIQGNLSTVLVALYAVLAPYISQYVSQELFLAIGGLILVLWSAYNPNTLAIFGNDTPVNSNPVQEYEDGLNQEYSSGDDDGC